MTTAFSYASQKVLKKYENDPQIKPIIKDIANARQGVVTFSKEVKKYMLGFIHDKYDKDPEVSTIIEILKRSGRYESFNFYEIFQLQDEAYFWYEFLNAYAIWKIIGKEYRYMDAEDALKVLVRLIKNDMTVFEDYSKIKK